MNCKNCNHSIDRHNRGGCVQWKPGGFCTCENTPATIATRAVEEGQREILETVDTVIEEDMGEWYQVSIAHMMLEYVNRAHIRDYISERLDALNRLSVAEPQIVIAAVEVAEGRSELSAQDNDYNDLKRTEEDSRY